MNRQLLLALCLMVGVVARGYGQAFLVGVDSITVVIAIKGATSITNVDSADIASRLKTVTELQLRQGGFTVVDTGATFMVVNVTMLQLRSGSIVYNCSTSLAIPMMSYPQVDRILFPPPLELAHLSDSIDKRVVGNKAQVTATAAALYRRAESVWDIRPYALATVWTQGGFGTTPVSDISSDLAQHIREELDVFLNEYLTANPVHKE